VPRARASGAAPPSRRAEVAQELRARLAWRWPGHAARWPAEPSLASRSPGGAVPKLGPRQGRAWATVAEQRQLHRLLPSPMDELKPAERVPEPKARGGR